MRLAASKLKFKNYLSDSLRKERIFYLFLFCPSAFDKLSALRRVVKTQIYITNFLFLIV